MNELRDRAIQEIARAWSAKDSELSLNENGFDWLPGSHTVRVHTSHDEREPPESIGPVGFEFG